RVCMSFIPTFWVGVIKSKRANILSDLYSFPDQNTAADDAGLRREDLDFVREMEDMANYATEGEGMNESAEQTIQGSSLPTTETWDLGTGAGSAGSGGDADRNIQLDNVTVIEDYSPGGAIHRFCNLLETESVRRNVRIAFLGDSFIEGDIITADVREQLQGLYGGQGVGFVAISSVTAQYRPTVKHTFGGWKDYQLAAKKNVPEEYRDRFFISGTLSVPTADSWVNYQTANYRKYISEVSNLRFFYSSTAPAEITFTVDGRHERTFEADTTGQVRQIAVAGRGFNSLKLAVTATDGFSAYGVSLEGNNGVLVDNYAIRSSTGLSLFGTSSSVNVAFDRMLHYDLIVLQYGLNIMSAEVTGYGSYGEQLRNLVRYIQRCFPSAAIIVMGVADRSMQKDGDFVTMPAVAGMIKEQRAVAEDCGVAFWNTYEAMGGYNSMKKFAEWGWAAKDYTHLSFAGGRKIATELVKALEYAKLNPYIREGLPTQEEPEPEPVTAVPSVEPGNLSDDSTPAGEDRQSGEPESLPDNDTWNIGAESKSGPEEEEKNEPDAEFRYENGHETEAEEGEPKDETIDGDMEYLPDDKPLPDGN
ncbi:MAG: hypothetical protein LIO77_04410, partial [Rikenellaceae bacterium]|nr:hypothetical protein [Rikenellaceae bacterium]